MTIEKDTLDAVRRVFDDLHDWSHGKPSPDDVDVALNRIEAIINRPHNEDYATGYTWGVHVRGEVEAVGYKNASWIVGFLHAMYGYPDLPLTWEFDGTDTGLDNVRILITLESQER